MQILYLKSVPIKVPDQDQSIIKNRSINVMYRKFVIKAFKFDINSLRFIFYHLACFNEATVIVLHIKTK